MDVRLVDIAAVKIEWQTVHRIKFYSRSSDQVVICTHGWGKQSSRRQQDAEFEKCVKFKRLYEDYGL